MSATGGGGDPANPVEAMKLTILPQRGDQSTGAVKGARMLKPGAKDQLPYFMLNGCGGLEG